MLFTNRWALCIYFYLLSLGYLYTAPGDILIYTRDETDGDITGATVKVYQDPTSPTVNPVPCNALPSIPVVSKTGAANFVRLVKGSDFTTDPDPSPLIPNGSKLTFVIERDGFVSVCIDNGGLGFVYNNTCNPDSTEGFNDCSTENKVNLVFSVRIEIIKRADGSDIGINASTGAKAELTNTIFYDTITDTGAGVPPTDDNASTTANAPRLCTTNKTAFGGDDCTTTPKFLVPVPFASTSPKTFRIFIAGYKRTQASLTTTASFGQTKVTVKFDNTCTSNPITGCGPSLDFSTTLDKIETELGGLIGIGSPDATTSHLSDSTNTTFIPAEPDTLNGAPYLDTANKKWLLPITSNFFSPSRSINTRINGFAESANTTFNNSLFATPDTTITYQFDDTCAVNICSPPLKYAARVRVNNIETSTLPSDLGINLATTNTFTSLSPSTFNRNGNVQYGKCSEDASGTANCVYIPVKDYLGANTSFDALVTIDGFTQGKYNFSGTTLFTQQNFSTSPTPPLFSVKIDKAKDELGKGFSISGTCPQAVSPCNANITSATLTISGEPSGNFSIVKTVVQADKVLIAISGTKTLHEVGSTINGQITAKINGFIGSDAAFNGVRTPLFNLNLNSQIDIQFGISDCMADSTVVCSEAHKYKIKFDKLFAKALPNCTPDPQDPQDVSLQIKDIPPSAFTMSSSLTLNGSIQTNTPSDSFYYLPLIDDNNGGTQEILSIGKSAGITLNLCSQTGILYAGVDIDISNAFTVSNLAKQFELQIAPTASCTTGTSIICTNSFLTFNSLKIVTKDETGGKITGARVSIYKSASGGLCASLPINADKIIADGTDSDGQNNGEILSISPGFANNDKLTFVIEKDGYVKRCDDNAGAGYTFSTAADASSCQDPATHNTSNCFFEYMLFNVVISIVKRSDDQRIGFITPDAASGAVINTSNTKIFGIEADTGTGTFLTSDGDALENRARFCSDNNANNPINNIGEDCTNLKLVLIPVLPTTKKFRILIAGYTEREIDLSGNSNIGTQQIKLVISDNPTDCAGVTCVSALQTSVVIDKIEDELGNTIGINSNGTIGSASSSSNTIFSDISTQFNGNPYIVSNKWFTPSTSNFLDNTFTVSIAGFTKSSTGNLLASTYDLTSPQKTVRFVQDLTNTTNCPSGSQTIKCFDAPKFAALIRINNIEGTFKPQDISYTLDTTNTFIKVVKNGITLGLSDFNAANKGTFNKCPGETNATTNCLYLPVINFLGQNQSMTVDLTIDGFTKVTYNFAATAQFTQQEPLSNSGNILFSVKIEKVKDELDKFFKIGGICNNAPNCNNSDITTSLTTITSTLTDGPAGSFSILKSFTASGKLFLALKGTKAISENESAPPTIIGKVAIKISGFIGENSQNIEISNISLSNTEQKELKFGFSDPGECPSPNTTIFCSPTTFKYKLKLTKIIAEDNVTPGTLVDVTTQIGSLLNKISSSNGASLNGIIQAGNILYIAIYDTTFNPNGTNNNTSETISIGTPNVQFTLNSKTTTYNKIDANISQIFFDANITKQFTLEIAPSFGTIKCSGAPFSVCTNSFFTVARLSITNIQIISPTNGKGFGGSTFKFQFTFTDINGGLPTSANFTLDTDLSLSISTADLIKEIPCFLTEVDPLDTNTIDGKDYFCEVILFFVFDGTNRGFNKGRFILKASSGNFNTTALSSGSQIVTVLDNPPELSENSVTPPTGGINTIFELRVKYKDKENNPPSFIEVLADTNGNNVIETNEIFTMTKVNINDDAYSTLGVMYRVSLTISNIPPGNKIRYAYRAGDGFVDEKSGAITTLLPAGFKINDISSGAFLEIPLSSTQTPPTLDWADIAGFEQEKLGLGFVSPDSGTSGDNFTFLVVYSSIDNIPASSVKVLYRDKYGARNLPLEHLTETSLSKLPSAIKTALGTTPFLYDGNYVNKEAYFAVFPLFNSDITIYSVEASDGTFVTSLSNFNSVIKLTVIDNDNDGIDDKQEGVGSSNTNTRVSLNALDDPPKQELLYTFVVSGNAVFAPPPQNPFFTSITAPGNLEGGVLGSGKIPPPQGVENSKLLALFQLGVRVLSGDKVTFTTSLPYALPTSAKVFKLGKGNIWTEITNIINLSSDRKSFSFDVENNSDFDRDSDFFGSADPGGFKFIVDPIGIFAPEIPITPPPPTGGGCYIHPKNSDKYNDNILLLTILLPLIYVLLKIIYKTALYP